MKNPTKCISAKHTGTPESVMIKDNSKLIFKAYIVLFSH